MYYYGYVTVQFIGLSASFSAFCSVRCVSVLSFLSREWLRALYTKKAPVPRRVGEPCLSLDLPVVHELHRVVSHVVEHRHHHDPVRLVIHQVPVGAGLHGVHSAVGLDLLAVPELQHGVSLRLDHEHPHGGVLQVLHQVRGSAVYFLLSVALMCVWYCLFFLFLLNKTI